MMKSMWLRTVRCAMLLAGAAAILPPATAEAQITRVSSSSERRQAIGVTLGGFFLRAADARVPGDVLLANLEPGNIPFVDQSLLFDVKDFNSGTVTGEWLVGVSDYLEVGVGAGFYQKTVPTVYFDQTFPDGSEIEQELKLRVVPFTATLRFLPIGRASVTPYVGAGIGAFNWRYTERGEFVDFTDFSIFRNPSGFVAKGTAIGPVILAGIRAPLADAFDIGGELRWQKADADTKPETTQVLGDRIDLGGWNAAVTFHVRF